MSPRFIFTAEDASISSIFLLLSTMWWTKKMWIHQLLKNEDVSLIHYFITTNTLQTTRWYYMNYIIGGNWLGSSTFRNRLLPIHMQNNFTKRLILNRFISTTAVSRTLSGVLTGLYCIWNCNRINVLLFVNSWRRFSGRGQSVRHIIDMSLNCAEATSWIINNIWPPVRINCALTD